MTTEARLRRVGVLILVLALGCPIVQAQSPPRRRAMIVAFLKATGYPQGRPGYVVDHSIPLCAGGTDGPPNLQWQERQASYRKDVFERQLCAAMKMQGFAPMAKR